MNFLLDIWNYILLGKIDFHCLTVFLNICYMFYKNFLSDKIFVWLQKGFKFFLKSQFNSSSCDIFLYTGIRDFDFFDSFSIRFFFANEFPSLSSAFKCLFWASSFFVHKSLISFWCSSIIIFCCLSISTCSSSCTLVNVLPCLVKLWFLSQTKNVSLFPKLFYFTCSP